MDMVYSAPVHYDCHLVLNVIDDEWVNDRLPVEEVDVPAESIAPADDEDAVRAEEEEDEKWGDMGVISAPNASVITAWPTVR